MRTPLVAGNWKMNGTRDSARALVADVRAGLTSAGRCEVLVCPPHVLIDTARPGTRSGLEHARLRALRPDLIQISVTPFGLADTADEFAPQVVLYASGETTPGYLELRSDEGEVLWLMEWDLLGRFSLLRRGIAEDEDERAGY